MITPATPAVQSPCQNPLSRAGFACDHYRGIHLGGGYQTVADGPQRRTEKQKVGLRGFFSQFQKVLVLATQLFFLESHFIELAGIRDRNRNLIGDPDEERHFIRVKWLLVFAINNETTDRLSFDYQWDDRTDMHP